MYSLYQCYNIFFTSIPIMYFALFDFEFSKEEFLANYRHYKIGFKSKVIPNLIWNN